MIKTKKAPYLSRGKPERRPHLINEDDHTIVNTYGAEWRGIVQYYLLAGNVHRLYRLLWVMETSLLKTLANKHRSSVSTMARKYAATVNTPHGLRKCFEARIERSGRKPLVARFGGIPLRRQKDTAISDRVLVPGVVRHKELVTRLLADRCELCKGTDGISVHHVRQLADLDRPGQPQPEWAQLMARRRRKTLVVCRECHNAIHSGQPAPRLTQ
ncbi:group II intron reverse transcriptase/maturase [Saccharopolyspora elongata]|uniref:group II intron reverse transcriptase/maturase n=1 Tax=Saccharopolyspora elongata TaxID=2530387 RepID=UPI0038B67006